MWISQSYFSLRFLSQNSFWKLSTFRGYKVIYSRVYAECEKSCFNQIGHSGDSTSRLERVASLSRELIAWPDWKFCPVVLQLTWPFNSPACYTHVPLLATIQSRASREALLECTQLSFLHILSHTTLTKFSTKYRVSNC